MQANSFIIAGAQAINPWIFVVAGVAAVAIIIALLIPAFKKK